jgi:hypothetical protein
MAEVEVQEIKKRLTNYKLIKMEGKEYYYVETKKKSGVVYDPEEFKKYLDDDKVDLPSEVGSLSEKGGKHVFTPKN